MRSRFDKRPPAGPSGFVLVGVVIMVLALTILGLSLFSLSSYEAQFMNRSLDEAQLLQYAMGGLDRARFALTVAPESLVKVKRNLPFEYVTYARASQLKGGPTPDSLGPVAANGNDVEVIVQAEYRGVTRRVMGRYRPESQENFYKRLLTVSGSVAYPPGHFPDHGAIAINDSVSAQYWARNTVELRGRIWSNCDSTWSGDEAYRDQGIRVGGVQPPEAGNFISTHLALASEATVDLIAKKCILPGTPGTVTFWKIKPADQGLEFSLHQATSGWSFQVRGRAVLLLERGMRFDDPIEIKGSSDPNACLVVVAQHGSDLYAPDAAIWLFSSFGDEVDIPVIFVSDAAVLIEHFYNNIGDSSIDNLSIFANRVFFGGPKEGIGKKMTLRHPTGASQNAFIDSLMVHGGLPNPSPVGSTPFALRPGTWRVLQ